MITASAEDLTPTVTWNSIDDAQRLEADVAVIGAGLAGLTAARELHQAGFSVVVLEARDRIGGRALSHPIGDGKIIELGCEHLGRATSTCARIAESIGVSDYLQHDVGDNLTVDRGKLTRWRGATPKLPPHVLFDLAQAVLRLEKMRRDVPETAPWTAPQARNWDGQTFSSWIQRNVHTGRARQITHALTHAGFAVGAQEVSLLHVLNYANALGGYRAITQVRGGALEKRFTIGSQGFATRLGEPVRDHVYLNAKVTDIEHRPDKVVVRGPRFTVNARRAIVSVPVPLAGRIYFDPPLPGSRDQLAQRLGMGAAIKYLAIYEEPFWRHRQLSGNAINLDGPVRATMDGSPPDGSPGVLTAFVTGPPARTLDRQDSKHRRTTVLESLQRMFGQRAGHPIDFHEKNWLAEEFTRGCYHGSPPPGLYTEFGPALREPIGPIHWAGAESAPIEYGSMSGAVDSGLRAAHEVSETLWHAYA